MCASAVDLFAFHSNSCFPIATLSEETADARRQLMELVRPYVVLPVRYPIWHLPDCHYDLPMTVDPHHSASTPHGLFPPYRDPRVIQIHIIHFGFEFVLMAPLVAIAARLLYFARSEATPFNIPDTLPVNRDAALAQNITGIMPTQEDYIRFNQHKAAAVVHSGRFATSTDWDEDWQRMRWCHDPWAVSPLKGRPYVHGSLAGTWVGRMLVRIPSRCMRTICSLYARSCPIRISTSPRSPPYGSNSIDRQ